MIGGVTRVHMALMKVMVRPSNEVCGVREKGVFNPWVIGRKSMRGLMTTANEAMIERNQCVGGLNARHGMSTKSVARSVRKEMMSFMRRIEREL